MRWQFSSIFPYLFFISLFLLPLSRPPYHAFSFILVCVLGLFFVNVRKWIRLRRVRTTAGVVALICLIISVAQFFSLGLAGSTLPWLLLLVGIGMLVPFRYVVEIVGPKMVSLMLIGIILLWTQWGVAQFVMQRDLGFNLAGESNISPEISAVAKFSVGNQKFMRAYGPFLHANTFGGVTLLGILLAFGWLMGEQPAPSLRRNQFALAVFLTLYLGLFLSFSRAAILGGVGILGVMLITFRGRYRYVPLICFLLSVMFLPLLFFRTTDPQDVALSERSQGLIWWSGMISQQPWWQGVGIGGYETALRGYLQSTSTKFESWQIAPVHSVPLLVLSELGILWSLLIFVIASFVVWHRFRFQAWRFLLILLSVLPALLLDHYFFTQLSAMVLLLMAMELVLDCLPTPG